MRPQSNPGQNWTPGRLGAPPGTQEWADFVRLKLVSHVEHLGEDDDGWLGYLELLDQHRAWSLLTKHDGSTFRTREEFCAYKRPWGLGTPWEKLKPYVRAAYAKRGMDEAQIDKALQLDGVPVGMSTEESLAAANAARLAKEAGSSRGQDVPTRSEAEEREQKRLRAILRAPEVVQELYREGLIGQVEAARLGPKSPAPEKAAAIAELAAELRKVERPADPKARRETQRAINATVRERTGASVDPVGQLLRMFARLSPDDRDRFLQLATIARGETP